MTGLRLDVRLQNKISCNGHSTYYEGFNLVFPRLNRAFLLLVLQGAVTSLLRACLSCSFLHPSVVGWSILWKTFFRQDSSGDLAIFLLAFRF